MSRRPYLSRFECGHEGCREFQTYESDTRADQTKLYQRYGNKQWRCVRHTQPDEVLTPTNLSRVYEIVSDERSHGVYWGHFGFVYGPGFKAFAKDFPPGTTLRVTAEIIPARTDATPKDGTADRQPNPREDQ